MNYRLLRVRDFHSTHPLNTPLNTSSQHIISTHPLNPPHQPTPSTHLLSPPSQHILSTNTLNARRILNTPTQHILSTHHHLIKLLPHNNHNLISSHNVLTQCILPTHHILSQCTHSMTQCILPTHQEQRKFWIKTLPAPWDVNALYRRVTHPPSYHRIFLTNLLIHTFSLIPSHSYRTVPSLIVRSTFSHALLSYEYHHPTTLIP